MELELRGPSLLKRKYTEYEEDEVEQDDHDNKRLSSYPTATTRFGATACDDGDQGEEKEDAVLSGVKLAWDISDKGLMMTGRRSIKKVKIVKPFPFFDLPRELRDMVYRYALSNNGFPCAIVTKHRDLTARPIRGIIRHCAKHNPVYSGSGHSQCMTASTTKVAPLATGLLTVSKRMHEEATPVLYEQEFQFASPGTMADFLCSIPVGERALLRRLTVLNMNGAKAAKQLDRVAFTSLLDAQQLRKLSVGVYVHHASTLEQRVLQVLAVTGTFIRLYGKAHGDKYAALRIIDIADANFEATSFDSYGKMRELPEDHRVGESMEENKAKFGVLLRQHIGRYRW